MNNMALALTFSLVIIALMISYRQNLGMERDMIIGSIRAVVQLTVVGFILKFVFNMDSTPLTMIILCLMVYNAAAVASKRGAGITHAKRISFGAILVGLTITLGCLLAFQAISFKPSEVIPVSGMVVAQQCAGPVTRGVDVTMELGIHRDVIAHAGHLQLECGVVDDGDGDAGNGECGCSGRGGRFCRLDKAGDVDDGGGCVVHG